MDATVLDRLPHRPPFRFLSRVVGLETGVAGEAIWRVDGDEPFLQGHFPGEPIVPGVLIGEALAQLSGLVAGTERSGPDGAPARGRLAHIDLRFDAPVTPPAELRLHSTLKHSVGGLMQFEVAALLGESTVARGVLALSIFRSAAGGRA